MESLGDLRKKKIISTPLLGLLRWTKSLNKKPLRTPDLICFPWAVVEFKRQNEHEVRCYCQAANASVAALELQADMFCKVFGDEFPKVGPVVSFTCVGPIVKVWLTYFLEPDSRGVRARVSIPNISNHRSTDHSLQQMVCIWSTSVRLTWGVAALRAIIMNMHTWASRLLKPKLQSAILHALRQSKLTSETRKPAPVVDDDLSGLSTPPRPTVSHAPRRPPSTPIPSNSPKIAQVFSPSCKHTNTVSKMLSPQAPVPLQQVAAAIPQGRPHSPLSLGTKDHSRTDTTPDSSDCTLIARKNNIFDLSAMTDLFASCNLQTTAAGNRCRGSNISTSSEKQPQDVPNIPAPVPSPENESTVVIGGVSQESGCAPKLQSCDNPNVSSIQSPMLIWETLPRNKAASTELAPTPRQNPLIQLVGGPKFQAEDFLSSDFSFEFLPSRAFKSPGEPFTPTPKGSKEAIFSDRVLPEPVSDAGERSYDIKSTTLLSEAEVLLACGSTAALGDGQIEGPIPGPIVSVSPPGSRVTESDGPEESAATRKHLYFPTRTKFQMNKCLAICQSPRLVHKKSALTRNIPL